MAEIPIWPGSSSFGLVADPTPFGFYDDDDDFRIDADKVAGWAVQRLGYPLVDIELQDINFYSCFEEATSEYGAQVYNATIIHNFGSLINTITGSNDQTLNNIVISSDYGSNAGEGSSQDDGGTTGNTFYYNGGALIPIVNDIVYKTKRARNPNTFPPGFYKVAAGGKGSISIQLNSSGVCIARTGC